MGAIHGLLRNGFVLAGVLLLGVGAADALVGRIKCVQYEDIVRSAPAAEPRSPADLFPTASEGRERTAVARAKLGYYQLLLTAGDLFGAVGLFLLALGMLQVRMAGPRPHATASGLH
ncbi:MAG TPA: hypothetical protein VKW76_11320 [Candidatus Binatia bacterium]|nr:hypothetical protein [Candidatus Binatia bacterium]